MDGRLSFSRRVLERKRERERERAEDVNDVGVKVSAAAYVCVISNYLFRDDTVFSSEQVYIDLRKVYTYIFLKDYSWFYCRKKIRE